MLFQLFILVLPYCCLFTKISEMTSVIICYRLPKLSESQIEEMDWILDDWERILKNYGVELVFVDDHSGTSIDRPYIHKLPGESIPWNQPAGRNYGAKLATGETLLFVDLDHLVHGDYSLLNNIPRKEYWGFSRYKYNDSGEREQIDPHPNIIAVHKNSFVGYNEKFCGHYGYDDIEFRWRMRKSGMKPRLIEHNMRSVVIDIPKHNLIRDTTFNKRLFEDIRKTAKDTIN